MKTKDLFAHLEKEERQELRKLQVKGNERLEKMLDHFFEVLAKNKTLDEINCNFPFADASASDISGFSLLLHRYQNLPGFMTYAGAYISTLTHHSSEKKFSICTRHLDKKIDYLGYKNNGKEILVKGDAGNFLGTQMGSGMIHVSGSAGFWAGNNMCRGKIYIGESAGAGVGNSMYGGEIHLGGDFESISVYHNLGEIYHRGKLIFKDGREI